MENLEKKDFIRHGPTRGRAIEVLLPGELDNPAPIDNAKNIPLVGRIADVGPITVEQEIEETFPLLKTLLDSGELFKIKVVGESMFESAICDEDYVVIRSQKYWNNGEIVDAMIDGEATMKNLSHKNGRIWLLPAI